MNSTLRSILISTALVAGLAGAAAPVFAQEQQQQEQEQEKPAPSTDEKSGGN